MNDPADTIRPEWSKQYDEEADALEAEGYGGAADTIRTLVDGLVQQEREADALVARCDALENALRSADAHLAEAEREATHGGTANAQWIDMQVKRARAALEQA